MSHPFCGGTIIAIDKIKRQVVGIIAERRHSTFDDAAAMTACAKELDTEIERSVDAIVSIGASKALANRLRAAEVERAELGRNQIQAEVNTPSIAEIEQRISVMLANLESAHNRHLKGTAELYGKLTSSPKIKYLR